MIKKFEDFKICNQISKKEFYDNISDYWENRKKEIPFDDDDKEKLKGLIKYLRKMTTDFSKSSFNKGHQILLSFYKSNMNAPDNFRIYKTNEHYFVSEYIFDDEHTTFYKFSNIEDMINCIESKIK